MGRASLTLPTGRTLALVDIGMALWAAWWIAVGLAVADEVQALNRLSGTVQKVGNATVAVGEGLSELDDVPFVGDRLGRTGSDVRAAGQSAVDSGRVSERSVERLSFLLGLAIAVIPSVPLLGLYLPLRVSRALEAAALRRTLARWGPRPGLERLLAERALLNLSYARLQKTTPDPWRALEEEDYSALAAAELARLGLDAESREMWSRSAAAGDRAATGIR